jgi:metal-sulfur cluster biosynthetic enzyme
VSLVDLGLVYGLDVEGKRVRVRLTFTATACPCMELIEEDIRDRLQREPWIEEVGIERVWDPPWTAARVSEAGRRVLGSVGIAV